LIDMGQKFLKWLKNFCIDKNEGYCGLAGKEGRSDGTLQVVQG